MPLTNDQQNAVDKFYDFLFSPAQTFTLSGGAGTGKTYLMDYISSTVMKQYEQHCALIQSEPKYVSAAFTATTNKAAEVLELSIGKPVQTIHSFLSLKVREDTSTGKTYLSPTVEVTLHKTVLFVDEASMIDEQLYQAILAAAKECKIVFVGDQAQMTPVKEVMSPIYAHVNPEYSVFLSEPVRNADTPALVDLCAQLRGTVESGEFFHIDPVPGVIEYLNGPQMKQMLETVFFAPNSDSRVLCYTNARVQEFNNAIRDMKQLPSRYMPGEKLVAARNYFKKPNQIAVERQVWVMETHHQAQQYGYANYTPDGQEIQAWEYKVSATQDHHNTFCVPIPCDAGYAKKTLANIKRKKDWPMFFKFQNQFADLRPVDACTVYKSQGSTYDSVFIDIGNIGTCYDPEQVARMLFVAASRARKKVYLFGQLPAKYSGKKVA